MYGDHEQMVPEMHCRWRGWTVNRGMPMRAEAWEEWWGRGFRYAAARLLNRGPGAVELRDAAMFHVKHRSRASGAEDTRGIRDHALAQHVDADIA